jgi:hypothetical protein
MVSPKILLLKYLVLIGENITQTSPEKGPKRCGINTLWQDQCVYAVLDPQQSIIKKMVALIIEASVRHAYVMAV